MACYNVMMLIGAHNVWILIYTSEKFNVSKTLQRKRNCLKGVSKPFESSESTIQYFK